MPYGQNWKRNRLRWDPMHCTEIVARFPSAKRSGTGWSAKCPVHDDRKASLSISQGADGRTVLYCHAGCAAPDILAAHGLTLEDCFDTPRAVRDPVPVLHSTSQQATVTRIEHTSTRENTPAAVYDYTDRNGVLLAQVVRGADKTFRQRKPDGQGGWTWKGDSPRVPYRWPELSGIEPVWVCYAPDTEVLTPWGWVAFWHLQPGQPVAQYALDGSVSFVVPSDYQEFAYDGPLVHVRADFCDLLVTPDHRMLVRGGARHDQWRVKPASALRQQEQIPVAGCLQGSDVSPTPNQARLLAAYLGDGCREQRCQRRSWNAKKPRKIARLKLLLERLGIPYRSGSIPSAPGWTQTVLMATDAPWLETFVPRKVLGWEALQWTVDARRAFLDELRHWDGDSTGRKGLRFFTAKQYEADIVSALAAVTNMGAIVRREARVPRPSQQPQFVVNLKDCTIRSVAYRPRLVENPFGIVMCVTVPSGFLVVRREGKVVISGNCEGEKDADALVALGLTATTNRGGAGKWKDEETAALVESGVTTVYVIPDHDIPGRTHANAVVASCRAAGLTATLVPLPGLQSHGDVSDWLRDGGTVEALLELATAAQTTPVPAALDAEPDVLASVFTRTGEGSYQLAYPGLGITLDATQVHRDKNELHGEITVTTTLAGARTVDGVLLWGAINFSSQRTRAQLATSCAGRSGAAELDWLGMMEACALKVARAEREGQPIQALKDHALPDRTEDWVVDGLPILQRHPMILFGDGGAAKSYLALHIAATLASRGIKTLYIDWEFSGEDHRERLERLVGTAMPTDLQYVRCSAPLIHEAGRLQRHIALHGIQYAICDSIAFAVPGRPEEAEHAGAYFRAVRQLGIGSLHLAHTTKSLEHGEDKPFGSVFWSNGARSIWHVKRSGDDGGGENLVEVALTHKKSNTGRKLSALGLRLTFTPETTRIDRFDVSENAELAGNLPIWQRIKALVAVRPMTIDELAEELNEKPGSVGKAVKRMDLFTKGYDDRIRLATALTATSTRERF